MKPAFDNNKLLHDNITKTRSEDNISEMNNELNHIANQLPIGNRIECIKNAKLLFLLKYYHWIL